MSKKITLEGLDHFKDNENAMIAGKPESTNTATVAHAVGEYFYWKGVLNIVTAAIAVGGTIQTNTNVKPAVLADNVSFLKESTNELKTAIMQEYVLITSDDFAQISEKALKTKHRIEVHKGDYLTTEASNLYMRWRLFGENDTVLEEFRGLYDKEKIPSYTWVFQHDGALDIYIANGHNSGNSSAISPSDMNATIKIAYTYAARTFSEFNNLEPDIGYVETKKLDVTVTAGNNSVLYYAMDFIAGQNYVVKLNFSAFDGYKNRKYSLRTTTAQYISSQFMVDKIVIVDKVNPTLGQELVYRFTATAKENGDIAHYIAIELNPDSAASCTLQVYSVLAEDNKKRLDDIAYLTGTDIVSLNHGIKNLINQGNKPLNTATTNPLKLLHFSDIHGESRNLQRIVDMAEYLGSYIDDTICTGDMVYNNYSATAMDFWDAVDGAEDILMVVGNHDLADGEHGYGSDQIGQTVAYQTYFSPYISNWGVTMAGENLTYWYKDYASRKVRLIGLNYLLTGDALTAQNTWLASRLTEAKIAGYAVVIAEHTPPSSFTEIDCNFNSGIGWTYNEMPTSIQDTVKTFMNGGGEFACYIGGHAHRDLVGYNSNYPNQIFIDITTAQTTGADNDQYRATKNKSQDAANIVMIDTVTKMVKIIRVGADMDTYLRGRHFFGINYQTKEIIAES